MSLDHLSIDLLHQACLRERINHDQHQAPACVELFRRAFDGDQEAWACIQSLFAPLMRSWIGVQRTVESDDVLQDAFLVFFRFAPRRHGLLASGDARPILVYLRKSTKTALLMQLRRLRRLQESASLDALPPALAASPEPDFTWHVEARQLLGACAASLKSEEEQVVFQLYFHCSLRPQEIQRRHPALFADVRLINTIVQRLTRRFHKLSTSWQDAVVEDKEQGRLERAASSSNRPAAALLSAR